MPKKKTKKVIKKPTLKKAREEALKMIKKGDYTFRSCWECNGAHEHLKKCTCPISCFACGHWYFKGIKLSK